MQGAVLEGEEIGQDEEGGFPVLRALATPSLRSSLDLPAIYNDEAIVEGDEEHTIVDPVSYRSLLEVGKMEIDGFRGRERQGEARPLLFLRKRKRKGKAKYSLPAPLRILKKTPSTF